MDETGEANDIHLEGLLNNNKQSVCCAPLTSFDWNEDDPNLIGTSRALHIGSCARIHKCVRVRACAHMTLPHGNWLVPFPIQCLRCCVQHTVLGEWMAS